MSSGTTSGAGLAQGSSSQNTSPASAPASSASTTAAGGVVTQAPLVPPSMEFPQPAVLENYTTASNTLSFTTRGPDGSIQHTVLEDYDAPVPLKERVKGSVKEAGVTAANCCLGCVCHLCCGI
ncbi:hypothetical protein ANO14919_072140 [Xylariales sp. No.14919]|nr:hypothetical protein ANO14919_072140 [Xylariales sp. No.14919]